MPSAIAVETVLKVRYDTRCTCDEVNYFRAKSLARAYRGVRLIASKPRSCNSSQSRSRWRYNYSFDETAGNVRAFTISNVTPSTISSADRSISRSRMCSSSCLFSLYRHRIWNFHDVNALFERISSDSSSAVSFTGTSAPLFLHFSPRSDRFQRDDEMISFETKARDRAPVPTLRQFTRNRLWLTSFPRNTALWLQIFLLLSAIFHGHRD